MSDDRELAAGEDDDSDADSDLQYRRLRAPSESGESLQIPLLSQTVAQWSGRSDRSLGNGDVEVNGIALSTLKQQSRSELMRLANEYTRRYRDVDLTERDAKSIVMSGHQPTLFHPGVWFKNFALSSIGANVGAMPVNLVVDNDVCGPAAIKCPSFVDGRALTRLIDIDAAHAAVPYEVRSIVDETLFDSFSKRATAQVTDCFTAFGKQAKPLVSRLWQHVESARKSLGGSTALGAVLAAGRHCLEQEAGLQSLEIPISLVAQTQGFANFASSIMKNQSRFTQIYNARLVEYRAVHGIRSNAHPVPELEQTDGWLESPFWIWSNDQPQRKRLFTRQTGRAITLTDRAELELEIQLGDLPSALLEVAGRGIAIRPRALITTLYSRLLLSDLFLHGIGGAKYDQLTDLIASDFFGVTLSPFSTLTASMHLPLEYPMVIGVDRSKIKQELRKRKYHPERFINLTEVDSTEAMNWIDQKRAAIGSEKLTPLECHQAIGEANLKLQPFVAEQVEALRKELASVDDQIHNSRILNSREYSFCLFPDSLIDDLKRLSSCR